MSLVVARKFGNDLIILSDTKLSSATGGASSPHQGIIKCKILRSQLAIGWAGNPHFAERALTDPPISENLTQITNYFCSHHIQSKTPDGTYGTDFLIGSTRSRTKLIVIKDGFAGDGQENAWIGSHPAFDHYQRVYHSRELSRSVNQIARMCYHPNRAKFTGEQYNRMTDAFMEVIESSNFPEVGDFRVPLLCSQGIFRYGIYTDNAGRPLPFLLSHGGVTLNMGQPSRGDYTISFGASSSNLIGFYFYEGAVGLVFNGQAGDIIKSDGVLRNISDDDFLKYMESRSKSPYFTQVRPAY